MPKTPSQFVAFAKKPLALGGIRDAGTLSTTPIYSRPLYLANRTRLHMEIEFIQAAGSTVDELSVALVFHWDKDTDETDWAYMVDAVDVVDPTGSNAPIRAGMIDKQYLPVDLIKSGAKSQWFSFMFKLGDDAPRYPFARCEVFATGGASHADDDLAFRLPYGDGEWHEPPDHTGGDPGHGEGQDIDP